MATKVLFGLVLALALSPGYCGKYPTNYDEGYAKQMINFAAASFIAPADVNHESLAKQCFDKSFPNDNFQLVKISSLRPCASFNTDECQYMISKSESLKMIVIAFRGTVGKNQMDNEAHESLDDYVNWDITPGADYGRVNKYFYEASESTWTKDVASIINQYSNYKIAFTGHSLGGAIASITALKARIMGFTGEMTLYTFGEPRLGDNHFAETFKLHINDKFRVIHNSDLVPHMPMCKGFFRDSCVKEDKHPYHQPQEIWYNNKDLLMNDGDYVVCSDTDGEDPDCSNSLSEAEFVANFVTDRGADMHLHYFKHKLDTYGPAGCNGAASLGFSLIALSLLAIQKFFMH